MKKNKKIAKTVGILFIIGTVSGSLSMALSDPILKTPDFLDQIAINKTQVILGALLELIMGIVLVAIPYVIYPVLKKYNKQIALGYIGARSMEGIGYIFSVITLLTLTSLSPDIPYNQTLGASLISGRMWINYVGVYIVFNLGALLFYSLLYKSKLIPRFLSAWGFIAAVMWLSGVILITLNVISDSSPIYTLSFTPMFAQEMVMALWLIVKGFNNHAINSMSSNVSG